MLKRRKKVVRPDFADRKGAVTVEFALCSFIIFLLFLGLIEFARFHVVRHTLDQAAYEGARAGIIIGSTANDAETVAQQILSAGGIVSPTVSVTPSTIDDSTLEVTVQVQASYSANSWTMPKFFQGATITAETTLDHENVASQ